ESVADYFLDLHTGGDRFVELPFVLYSLDAAIPTERYDDLARGFGIPHLWRDTARIFPSDAMATFNAFGIPSFLVEVGGGQPIDPEQVGLQADAVRSFLRKVGALPGRAATAPTYTILSGYKAVTNARGGFLTAAVKPGDRIKEGDVLGTISDLYGDPIETIRAPAGARIVLGVNTYPAWPTGGWLFEVGSGLTESPGAAPRPGLR
ncbi:MAG TPA: succinylglutamate desuccinylase/aspartoacylase family protein, partial [Candidatus Polarisedimenticolia bacterium]|nr:succinylglutamate desuccinylase/aspartoacylase family protein [Candidatus Polarisedimenticolia bacterium]